MKKFILFIFVILFAVSCDSGGGSGTGGSTTDDQDVAVSGVSLSKSNIDVYVGDTYTLTATVMPSDATTSAVTWSSDDESVVTVSGGVVTGVSDGEATITVKTADGGYVDTCDVTVTYTPDEYELNDTFDTAKSYSQQGFYLLSFTTGEDVDWFKFTSVSTSLGISIWGGKIGSNDMVDVNLYLYDSSQTLVASATSNNVTYNYSYAIAYLEYKPSSSGTYYVKVVSRNSKAGNYYFYRHVYGDFD